MNGDRGSASIWVLGVAALVLLVGAALGAHDAATLARHRADTAADLSALAAAAQIGIGPAPCPEAARVAASNGARMDRCSVDLDPSGRSGTVEVTVSRGVRLAVIGNETVSSTARARRDA